MLSIEAYFSVLYCMFANDNLKYNWAQITILESISWSETISS